MKDNTAISVKGVKKNFLLPHEKTSSIKSGVVNVFRKKNRTISTQKALRGVSFDIKKGEFFGILGKNGSGKSTLLKILAEIYQPTEGSVDISGKLVPFIELGVGFNPELTGRENVYLNGALLGFSRKEIDARYDDIVKFAELEEFMDQKLKNYSSGMQVRLAFSVATRAEADILLVDEVLAVGDADFQRKCYDFFKSLKASGKTVIFVTHDMGAVREYCDRAVLIKEGIVAYEGSANKVADEYLKLFNKSKIREEEELPKKTRWGNGDAKIDKLVVDLEEDKITVRFDVVSSGARKVQIQPVFKFSDNDKAESFFAGTSLASIDSNFQSISLGKGLSREIMVEFDNIFSSNEVFLSVTLQSPDGVTMYDVWNNAISFRNQGQKNYYSVYPRGYVSVGAEQ